MAKGDSEYIYFYVADNIRIIEIEFVLKNLLAFNYVISLEVKNFKQDDRGRDSMPGRRRVHICDA